MLKFYKTYTTHSNDPDFKQAVQDDLEALLEQRGMRRLRMPLITCINELVVNGIKANYKNLYFEQYSPQNNALELIPYHKALQLFKLELSTRRIDYFENLARKKDVTVTLTMSVGPDDHLVIHVENPADMTQIEIENVQKKFSVAESYKNITEYFEETEIDPNKEGAGLGIIFIIMMMKNLGIPLTNLSITSGNNRTSAIFRIPLEKWLIDNYEKNIHPED